MTSSILPPRRVFAPCSPMTHARASTTFDLPDPFGPTMHVTPGSNAKVVGCANDLNPLSVTLFRCMDAPLRPGSVTAIRYPTRPRCRAGGPGDGCRDTPAAPNRRNRLTRGLEDRASVTLRVQKSKGGPHDDAITRPESPRQRRAVTSFAPGTDSFGAFLTPALNRLLTSAGEDSAHSGRSARAARSPRARAHPRVRPRRAAARHSLPRPLVRRPSTRSRRIHHPSVRKENHHERHLLAPQRPSGHAPIRQRLTQPRSAHVSLIDPHRPPPRAATADLEHQNAAAQRTIAKTHSRHHRAESGTRLSRARLHRARLSCAPRP